MNIVRHAITQARFNIAQSKLVAIVFAMTGLIAGAMTNSVVMGVGLFFALVVGCMLPVVFLLIVAGYTGPLTLALIDTGCEMAGIIGAIVIGGVGCLIAFGIHLGGMTGLVESGLKGIRQTQSCGTLFLMMAT